MDTSQLLLHCDQEAKNCLRNSYKKLHHRSLEVMTMSKKQAKAKSAKKTTKKPTHAVAKKKSALAVKEPQAGWIEEFNRLSEPFRLIHWNAFGGFEWTVETELGRAWKQLE